MACCHATPHRALLDAIRGVVEDKVALPEAWIRFQADALRLGPRTTPLHSAAFSARERDVLSELGRGRSNAEIGIRLGLKESTVKTHVASILQKTGVCSRHARCAPQAHSARLA